MNPHAEALEAWAARSRFGSIGLVLDLQDEDTPRMLRTIKSVDALTAVRLARTTRHRFVVMAGQLMRKRAGIFAVAVPTAEALPMVALAAAERLSEAGETWSAWFVLCADEPRAEVTAALAARMGAEGNA